MINNIVQLVGINTENNIITNKTGKSFFKNNKTTHSRYGLEFRKISCKQATEYDKSTHFIIPNNGNILYRCFFQIEIPDLIFKDNKITDIIYINYKSNKLSTYLEKINIWNKKYINLYNYSNIQIIIYEKLQQLIALENLTLDILKIEINSLVNTYENLNDYIKLINNESEIVLDKINLYKYISTLTLLDINTIKTESNNIFNFININLKYYYSNLIYYKKEYDNFNYGNVEYSWIKNLGHHYITNTQIITGNNDEIIDSYSNDILNIHQLQVPDFKQKNYNNLIGNKLNYNKHKLYSNDNNYLYSSENNLDNIINLNREDRNIKSNIIYTPLIFWFCNNTYNSLPIIAIEDVPLKIEIKINSDKNLIYFQDYEKEFYKYLLIKIPRKDHNFNFNNTVKEYINLNHSNVTLLIPEYMYIYTCSEINKTMLDLHFPGIESDLILENYGSTSIFDSNNNALNLSDWIFLRKKIHLNTDTFLNETSKLLLGGYDYKNLIDYNSLLNKIPKPTLDLIAEFGYVDDVEKSKLKMEKNEYLIRTYHEYSFDLDNSESNQNDIYMDGLIDNIYYFNRPKLFLNQNLSPYSKSELSKYSNYTLFSDIKNNYLKSFSLNITSDNNLFINDEINTNYYNYVVPYLYLSSILLEGIFYKNLCLYPYDYNPSGVFNSDILKNQSILVSLDETFKSLYFNSNLNNVSPVGIEFKIIYTKLRILQTSNQNIQLIN